MDPNQAFASGTKSTQLRNPVPGFDQEAQNQQDVASVDVPVAQQQERKPAAEALPDLPDLSAIGSQNTNVPAQQQPSQADASLLPSLPDLSNVSSKESPEDFDGKEIETSILGLKVKQDKDGNILVKHFGSKNFEPPNKTQINLFNSIYSTIKDAPATAGKLIGGTGGAIFGAGISLPGGGVASVPIGAAGAAVLGAVGAKYSEDVLSKFDPKFLYLLKKAGNVSRDEENPETPGQAARSGALSELFAGALVGTMASRALMSRTPDLVLPKRSESTKGLIDAVEPSIIEIQKASKDAGVDVTGAQALNYISSKSKENVSPMSSDLLSKTRSGFFGTEARENYTQLAIQQNKQIRDALKETIGDIAPGMDITSPSMSSVAQKVKEGFSSKNFFSHIQDESIKRLASIDAQSNELARNSQLDPVPQLQEQKAILRKLPGSERFFDDSENIDFNYLDSYVKDFLGNDPDARKAIGMIKMLDNHTRRYSAFQNSAPSSIPVSGSTPTFSEAPDVTRNASSQFQEPLDAGGGLMNARTGQSVGSSPGSSQQQFMDIVGGKEGSMVPGIGKPGFEQGQYSQSGPIQNQSEALSSKQPSMGSDATVQFSGNSYQPSFDMKTQYLIKRSKKWDGFGANDAGDARAGLTFAEMQKYRRTLQQAADKTGDSMLRELAGAARTSELSALAEIYESAGMPDRAKEIIDERTKFSETKDAVEKLERSLEKFIADPGGQVVLWDAPTIRMIKTIVSGMPKEFNGQNKLAEFRGLALANAIFDQMKLDPTSKFDPKSIDKMLFKNPKTSEAMRELFDEKTIKKIKGLITVADVLQNQNLSTAAKDNLTDQMARYAADLNPILGTLTAGRRLISGLMIHANQDAFDLLTGKLDNWKNLMSSKSSISPMTLRNLEKSGQLPNSTPKYRSVFDELK